MSSELLTIQSTSQEAANLSILTWDEAMQTGNLVDIASSPVSQAPSSAKEASSSSISAWESLVQGPLYQEKGVARRKKNRKNKKPVEASYSQYEVDDFGRVIEHYVSGDLMQAQERRRLAKLRKKEAKEAALRRDEYCFRGYYTFCPGVHWFFGINTGLNRAGQVRQDRLTRLQKTEYYLGPAEDPENDPRYADPPPGGSVHVFVFEEIVERDEEDKIVSTRIRKTTKIYGAGGRLLNPSEDEVRPGEKGITADHDGHVEVPKFVTRAMGMYIAKLRSSKGITQRDLGIKINAANGVIRDIEVGGIHPYRHDDPVLIAIAEFFGVPRIKYY